MSSGNNSVGALTGLGWGLFRRCAEDGLGWAGFLRPGQLNSSVYVLSNRGAITSCEHPPSPSTCPHTTASLHLEWRIKSPLSLPPSLPLSPSLSFSHFILLGVLFQSVEQSGHPTAYSRWAFTTHTHSLSLSHCNLSRHRSEAHRPYYRHRPPYSETNLGHLSCPFLPGVTFINNSLAGSRVP